MMEVLKNEVDECVCAKGQAKSHPSFCFAGCKELLGELCAQI